MTDKINPPHYKKAVVIELTDEHIAKGRIEMELIDLFDYFLTHEEFVGALKANVCRYITRLGKKDRVKDDLAKARWYTDYLEKILEVENTKVPREHRWEVDLPIGIKSVETQPEKTLYERCKEAAENNRNINNFEQKRDRIDIANVRLTEV